MSFKTVFMCSVDETNETELQCFSTSDNTIYFEMCDSIAQRNQFIELDVNSAIKLAKLLRTEINKIKSNNNE